MRYGQVSMVTIHYIHKQHEQSKTGELFSNHCYFVGFGTSGRGQVLAHNELQSGAISS